MPRAREPRQATDQPTGLRRRHRCSGQWRDVAGAFSALGERDTFRVSLADAEALAIRQRETYGARRDEVSRQCRDRFPAQHVPSSEQRRTASSVIPASLLLDPTVAGKAGVARSADLTDVTRARAASSSRCRVDHEETRPRSGQRAPVTPGEGNDYCDGGRVCPPDGPFSCGRDSPRQCHRAMPSAQTPPALCHPRKCRPRKCHPRKCPPAMSTRAMSAQTMSARAIVST